MRQTLQKKEILRGYQSFSNVLSGGKQYQQGIVRCFVLPATQGDPGVKVGFALARGIQPVARRNRIKRLLRESYRKNKESLLESATRQGKELRLVFLVVADKKRNSAKSPSLRDINEGVVAILKQIESVLRTTAP